MKLINVVGAFIIISTACTSAGKMHTWTNKGAKPHKEAKVLVIGLTGADENDLREKTENIISEELKIKGIQAESSFKLLGSGVAFERMDEDDALYQLNNYCIDEVLTITLFNRKKESEYLTGKIHDTPFGYYYDRFWRYRTTALHRISGELYYKDESDLFFECNIYNMVTQKIVYSFQSPDFQKSAWQKASIKLAGQVAKKLHSGL